MAKLKLRQKRAKAAIPRNKKTEVAAKAPLKDDKKTETSSEAQVLALKKGDQSQFKKKTVQAKKRNSYIKWIGDRKAKEGAIYLSRFPDGFIEKGMYFFFKQFGSVKKVYLARSKRTGRPLGYSYIVFNHSEVAKVVAETMNDYLMFGKLMKCSYVPGSKFCKKMFQSSGISANRYPKIGSRKKFMKNYNTNNTTKLEARGKMFKVNLSSKLEKLKQLGIDIDLDVDLTVEKKAKTNENEKLSLEADMESEEDDEDDDDNDDDDDDDDNSDGEEEEDDFSLEEEEDRSTNQKNPKISKKKKEKLKKFELEIENVILSKLKDLRNKSE